MTNTKKVTQDAQTQNINLNDTIIEKQNQIISDLQSQMENMQKIITQLQSKQALEQSEFKKSDKVKLTITTFLEKDQKPRVITI